MKHRGVTLLLALALFLGPVRGARAQDVWSGAFRGGFGFFVGGGLGGGLARARQDGETHSRYAVSLPLNLRAGFDIGRYGLALLIDTQYHFLWGPSRTQGPRPANRTGRFEMLSIAGEVLWRPIGPLYLVLGAGAGLTAGDQDMFSDPPTARAEVMTGIGFIYRMPRKETTQGYWPFGVSVSLESRYYLPWKQDFFNYSILAVLTFYLVFGAR